MSSPAPSAPPIPAFGGGSIADVLPAVLSGLDVPGGRSCLPLVTGRQICLLLVDGLGWNALRAAPDAAPFLSSLVDAPSSRVLTSVYPTTTPIALTSLGTGLAPGEHGVTGLYLRLPSGQVVNTLANPAETDMRVLQPRATAFEHAVAAGVTVTRVGPASFDGPGLTEAALRGGRYVAAESVGERVAAATAGVRRADTSLTYVYHGDLDATGHRSGCGSDAWLQELVHVDRVAEQLADALPAAATLLITSDHGMVDVSADNRWDVATTPALSDGVHAIAGDLRAIDVHTRPDAAADVLAAWRETLGEEFWVLSRAEAVDVGLYGPVVSDGVRPRIGDVVAAAIGDAAVVDSRLMPRPVLALVGLHGSVTDDELLVPLLVHTA
ncbi:MAG: alkaline phosphatase family protein [Sporichthyaceae bacterium]|nr:alkaline phosphatase family protein [Sporichthyaceae bacterium]